MKLILGLVVMCLVGAALSKSVQHRRSLDQVKKRGELEKLLEILLESDVKKDTAAKRSSGEDDCVGVLAPLGNAVAGLDVDDPNFGPVITLLDALTSKRKRRVLHWKRNKHSLKKRDDDGPFDDMWDCVEQEIEAIADSVGTCDISSYTPTDISAFDGLTCASTPQDVFNAAAEFFGDNSNLTDDPRPCMWKWLHDEEIFDECDDDKKK